MLEDRIKDERIPLKEFLQLREGAEDQHAMKSGNERFHEGTGLSDGEGGMKQELTGEDEEDDEGKIEAEDWFRPREEIERAAAMSGSLRAMIDRMGPRRQETMLN